MIFVIGEEIRKKVLEKGISFVAFADQIGMTDRNLQNFFKRSDISIHQLIKASDVLNHDFLKDYLRHTKKTSSIWEEPLPPYGPKKKTISIALNLSIPTDNLGVTPELIKDITETAARHGVRID